MFQTYEVSEAGKDTAKRVARLRELMVRTNVDAVLVPHADDAHAVRRHFLARLGEGTVAALLGREIDNDRARPHGAGLRRTARSTYRPCG